MRIDTVSTHAEFDDLRANWESVYSVDPEAQFFLSWIWLSQLFARRPRKWRVLATAAAAGDSNYVAFLPLRLKTRFSKSRQRKVPEIYMAGNFWADYTGLICHPDHEEDAIPALARHLRDEMSWERLHLENICASDRRLDLFKSQFPAAEFRTTYRNRTSKTDGINLLVCPTLALPATFDEYLQQRISANTRQKIRRFMRQIDAADDLRIVESVPATRERDIDVLTQFWQRRWAERKGDQVEVMAQKYHRILEQGLEAGIMHMSLLLDHDRPVALNASFVDREKRCMLFYVTARDMAWRRLPAGLVLHAYNIRWAIEQGMQEYHLLRGDEQYKHSLGGTDRSIACVRIERRRRSKGKADSR